MLQFCVSYIRAPTLKPNNLPATLYSDAKYAMLGRICFDAKPNEEYSSTVSR